MAKNYTEEAMRQWNEFIKAFARSDCAFESMRIVQLAQAILESGRGQSPLFREHCNPYGMKYRKEMAGIATSVKYTYHAGQSDDYCKFADYSAAVEGYARFIDRPVYKGWREQTATPLTFLTHIAYKGYIGGPFDGSDKDREIKNTYIGKVSSLFNEARALLAGVQPDPGREMRPEVVWRGKGVLIDVGHGMKPKGYDSGAVHPGGGMEIHEHGLNAMAAEAARAFLQAQGVPCVVNDDRLFNTDAGKNAQGFDVFVSMHHNSAEKPAQGSEALHFAKSNNASMQLAKMISKEVAAELGVTDRGAKPRTGLSILAAANGTNVRAACLAEVYFMHKQTPDNPSHSKFNDWSRRGGEAVGRAVLEWLKRNP